MTNNINQQKFTVLLKYPKEHEIITFKRSLEGGREEHFTFSKKNKQNAKSTQFVNISYVNAEIEEIV